MLQKEISKINVWFVYFKLEKNPFKYGPKSLTFYQQNFTRQTTADVQSSSNQHILNTKKQFPCVSFNIFIQIYICYPLPLPTLVPGSSSLEWQRCLFQQQWYVFLVTSCCCGEELLSYLLPAHHTQSASAWSGTVWLYIPVKRFKVKKILQLKTRVKYQKYRVVL